MTDSTFWQRAILQQQPEYNNLGEVYRASNRARGLPAMSEAWVAAHGSGNGPIHRAGLYDTAPPKQLLAGAYLSQPVVSQYERQDGESETKYFHRMKNIIGAVENEVTPEVYAAIVSDFNACAEVANGDTHEAIRQRLDTRKAGDNVGIFGQAPTGRGMQGVSYRDLQGSRAEAMMTRQQETRDAEAERLTWLRGATRTGYEPLAGEAAATVRRTTRQYGGNGGLFR